MPDLSTQQLKELFDQYGADLFALCYLQAGRPAQALDLMAAALCDMAANPRLWAQAASPREGFFRAAYLNCLDNSLRRPKRRKKKKDSPLEEVPRALPFTLTDPLRQVMKLRLAHKAALFCRERLGLSGEESARVLGTSPLRAQRLAESALKKAGVTQGQARANLEALAPGPENLERVWQEFLDQQGRGGFAARQRCRRARRFLDAAMPYLALGVVAVCAAAYLGVEYGWFGAPYTPTQPIEGVITQEGYDGDSAVSLPIETGDVSVFVPEEGGFAEYIVHNTPYSPEDILRQMVYLGGAPAGTTLLSASGIFPGGGLPVRGGGGADAPGHGRHLRRLYRPDRRGREPALHPLPGRRAHCKWKDRPGFPRRPADHHPHGGDGLPGVMGTR